MHYIVGDVGGTNTRLGLCSKNEQGLECVTYFENRNFNSFMEVFEAYLNHIDHSRIAAVCLGVASNIDHGVARLTNIDWIISSHEISKKLQVNLDQVLLLNDLEALAYRACAIKGDEFLEPLSVSRTILGKNKLVVAVGTGLGVSICQAHNGGYLPMATEAGHFSFAASSEEDLEISKFVSSKYSHASVERLVSGAFGFKVLYDFYQKDQKFAHQRVEGTDSHDCGPRIVDEALKGNPLCKKVCEKMLEILAGHVGNLSLASLPAGGIYLTGSVVNAIKPFLNSEAFIEKMSDKGRYADFLKSLPVMIYNEQDAALLGCKQRLELPG